MFCFAIKQFFVRKFAIWLEVYEKDAFEIDIAAVLFEIYSVWIFKNRSNCFKNSKLHFSEQKTLNLNIIKLITTSETSFTIIHEVLVQISLIFPINFHLKTAILELSLKTDVERL